MSINLSKSDCRVFRRRYPHELNSSSEQREVMTGGRFDQIDYLTQVVA